MALAQNNKIKFVAPPTLGQNSIDSWWDMDEKYCISMVNIEPKRNFSPVRKGFYRHSNTAAAYSSDVRPSTLFPYSLANGTFYALEIAPSRSGRLYRYSTTGTRTELLSGGVSVNIANSLACQFKNRVFFAGDGNNPYNYDGTTLTDMSAAWTGPALTTLLCAPFTYRGNLYFLYVDSTDVWFAPGGAITGALTRFPTDSFISQGSYLMLGGYTQPNDGVLASDLFVLVSNTGEVLVFQGTDPAASDWSLYGRYFIPPPYSRGSFFYLNGNLHIITTQGIYAMNDVLAGNREGEGQYRSISKNINPDISVALGNSKSVPYAYGLLGKAAVSPKENLLYVPFYRATPINSGGSLAYTYKLIFYIMDLESEAWSTYEVNSTVGEIYGNPVASPTSMYFITSLSLDNSFWEAGISDRDYTSQYLATSWSIRTRFMNCDFPGNKKFNKFRPILSETKTYTVETQSDFDLSSYKSAINYNGSPQTFVNKFSDVNKEGTFLSLLISGSRAADATPNIRTTFFGGFLTYEPGSNVP